MSTLYHTSYSSLVLNAPAGPEKTLSVLVLWIFGKEIALFGNKCYFAENIFSRKITKYLQQNFIR